MHTYTHTYLFSHTYFCNVTQSYLHILGLGEASNSCPLWQTIFYSCVFHIEFLSRSTSTAAWCRHSPLFIENQQKNGLFSKCQLFLEYRKNCLDFLSMSMHFFGTLPYTSQYFELLMNEFWYFRCPKLAAHNTLNNCVLSVFALGKLHCNLGKNSSVKSVYDRNSSFKSTLTLTLRGNSWQLFLIFLEVLVHFSYHTCCFLYAHHVSIIAPQGAAVEADVIQASVRVSNMI